jgi:hypothetical protein
MYMTVIHTILLKRIKIPATRWALAVTRHRVLPGSHSYSFLALTPLETLISKGSALTITLTWFPCFRGDTRLWGVRLLGFLGAWLTVSCFYLSHTLYWADYFLSVYCIKIYTSLVSRDNPAIFLLNRISSNLPLLLLVFIRLIQLLQPINLWFHIFLLHWQRSFLESFFLENNRLSR